MIGFPPIDPPHLVEEINPVGARAFQDAGNGCVVPDRALSRPVSLGVKFPCNLALATAFNEKSVCFPADGGFRFFHDELPVFPLIPEWRTSIDGLAELGAGEDGGVHTFREPTGSFENGPNM